MQQIPELSFEQLFDRYQTILLDAFGVLVDASGPLPGAKALIDRLNREGRHYRILTNSASRLPETMSVDYFAKGLEISTERILSSGMLLSSWFKQEGLQGSRCWVLGPEDSVEYVCRAGGEIVDPLNHNDADVVVIADQKGHDYLEIMNRTLSLLIRRLDAEKPTRMVLCNPDIIFPVGGGDYAFTSGGMAAMLEALLEQRYPGCNYRFERLGKPHLPIFNEVLTGLDKAKAVMIGDQPATDILGANRAGIDSVLMGTGLYGSSATDQQATATWFMPSFGE